LIAAWACWLLQFTRARQQDLDTATQAGRRSNIHTAAVAANDPLHRREPEAAPCEFGREKWIEHLALDFFGHATTGIGDL
jgi:hypothetical protein